MKKLIIQLNGETVDEKLLDKPVCKIGRQEENDLRLPSEIVSGLHAEIQLEQDEVFLIHHSKKKDTLVNSIKLELGQRQPLKNGDVIWINPYLITFVVVSEAASIPLDRAAQEFTSYPTQGYGSFSSTSQRLRDPQKPKRQSQEVKWRPTGIYQQYLPVIFHDNDFLCRYLQIFESIWEPLEQRQDHIERYFDPDTCPESFLPWLASWFGLEVNANWPETRLRCLLKEAMRLYGLRGTAEGLAGMIQVCAGVTVEIAETTDKPFVFHLRLKPEPDQMIDQGFIEELIKKHKPAHTAYVLEVRR